MATRAPANDLQAWLAGLEPEPCAAGEGAACLLYPLDRDAELPLLGAVLVALTGSRPNLREGVTLIPSVLPARSEEPTSELQSLMTQSYAVFCLKTKTRVKQT